MHVFLPDQSAVATDLQNEALAWFRTSREPVKHPVTIDSNDKAFSFQVDNTIAAKEMLEVYAVINNWNENIPIDIPDWQQHEQWGALISSILLWLSVLFPLLPCVFWAIYFREPKAAHAVEEVNQLPDNLPAAMVIWSSQYFTDFIGWHSG